MVGVYMVWTAAPQIPTYIYYKPSLPNTTASILTSIEPAVPAPMAEAAYFTVQNKSPGQNLFEWGNCTWGVASWINVPISGNANRWDDNARAKGYQVNPTEPLPGAVAQSDAGYYGHVALVLAVAGDTVYVREMNVLGLGVVNESWYPRSHFSSYIYLN